MHPYVRKLHRANEYYFKEGCYIIEVSNTDQDSAVSIAHARVLAGQQTAWHWLTGTYDATSFSAARDLSRLAMPLPLQ